MRIGPVPDGADPVPYENEVRWNLSESGVLPLRVEELLEGERPDGAEFLETGAASTPRPTVRSSLRERIALFYPGGTARTTSSSPPGRRKRTTRPSGDS